MPVLCPVNRRRYSVSAFAVYKYIYLYSVLAVSKDQTWNIQLPHTNINLNQSHVATEESSACCLLLLHNAQLHIETVMCSALGP